MLSVQLALRIDFSTIIFTQTTDIKTQNIIYISQENRTKQHNIVKLLVRLPFDEV